LFLLNHFIDLALVFGETLERPGERLSARGLRWRSTSTATKRLEQFRRHFVDRDSAGRTRCAFSLAGIAGCALATRTARLAAVRRRAGRFGLPLSLRLLLTVARARLPGGGRSVLT
jgi:hypothetical protein